MSLLTSEEGKRRLLTVELPAIERYNEGRDESFRIVLAKQRDGSLALRYRLKPAHNVYELETILPATYPSTPPETRVVSKLKPCPHLLSQQRLCLWKQGSTRAASRWDASKFTSVFAVQAAWRWLACYEVWYSSGTWPLPEAI
ncbi:hypothetical protein [Tuwongella immobilis]|uniref:Hypothetical conserved protein n=1 Tax=Tuwongella immobilis TaxID=692036 RepID=A0A6C2YLN3_9BACT|nr:hypothetical protein [Tuwongella immobilis]VIP02033.1 Hypothetical conserved protein OS=uncultured planctomycete GN=HGMM_F33C03C24 PE=4 SV=1 [Tuwongella immobilis]VTS00186.1 Hypothetical conserved protein OS=uncultured planctomycete GN=HGMM_F33C03C24 PE=4 SV=1 [Tuwongella immobilis]